MLIDHLSYLHAHISTPALVVDKTQLDTNLLNMQQYADRHNVLLRPHCKTHKSTLFARWQSELGAIGLTVAKAEEAEIFAREGFDDIFIANEITQKIKAPLLNRLHASTRLIVGVDHPRHITLLEEMLDHPRSPLEVRIEIDCGFQRCGIRPDDDLLPDVARAVINSPVLHLEGVFTHAGQAYGASNPEQIKQIAHVEARSVERARERLREIGIEIATLSVGSTPTARSVIPREGVTEARPGNYIFYDRIQHALGVCAETQWSLFVLATVISRPHPTRMVCDAGSKALNLDTGAHGHTQIQGYGKLMNTHGVLTRLSEEHGIIELDQPSSLAPGAPLLIAPNHACTVANLYDHYHLFDGDSVQIVPISARGKSR
ncbi:MAG: D-TA family PLP-dependent enzyme [Calditrichaeota bacterium]|nr:MAG: D-TA family PLP-dependent enzyme [Calditrichota bacterium]